MQTLTRENVDGYFLESPSPGCHGEADVHPTIHTPSAVHYRVLGQILRLAPVVHLVEKLVS